MKEKLDDLVPYQMAFITSLLIYCPSGFKKKNTRCEIESHRVIDTLTLLPIHIHFRFTNPHMYAWFTYEQQL